MWRQCDAGFWPWLERVLAEFGPEGLSIQTTVTDAVEREVMIERFLEMAGQARR